MDETAAGSGRQAAPKPPKGSGEFWVFGYGSLMWNPGFPFVESRRALLRGFHRRFCIRSVIYRGTPEQPGLVLGIDRGGECHGMAIRVAAAERDAVLEYLYAREMPMNVYTPEWVEVEAGSERVRALTFVVNRDHDQFASLSEEEMARIISNCSGANGSNFEYLENTVRALHALGVPDPDLDALHRRTVALRALCGAGDQAKPAAEAAG